MSNCFGRHEWENKCVALREEAGTGMFGLEWNLYKHICRVCGEVKLSREEAL